MFFGQNNQSNKSSTNKISYTHLQQQFFNVYVRTSDRKAYSIQISNNISKESFQQKIMSRIKIPVQNQILYYGGKNLNEIQQYSFSQKSIIHLIDKRQTNLDEINIVVKRIQPNSTPHTFNVKSSMKIDQFISNFLGGIYQKNANELFLVYVGKQLSLQKSFGQQFVANKSQIYCLHVIQDAKPIKPKKQQKHQNTIVIRKSIDQIPVKEVFSDEAQQQIQQNEPLKKKLISMSQQYKVKPFKKKRTFTQENILCSNDGIKKKTQEFCLKQSNQANVSEIKNEVQKIYSHGNNDDYSDSPTNIINQYYNESSERLQEQIEINKYFQSNEKNQNQQNTVFQQQREKFRNSVRKEILPSAGYSNIFNNMIWQEGKQFIKDHQKMKDINCKLQDYNGQMANKQLLGLMFTQEIKDETEAEASKQLQSFKKNTQKFNYSQEDEKKILNEFNSLFNNQQIAQDTATNGKQEHLKLLLQSKKWSPQQLKRILSKDYEKQMEKEQDVLSHHSNKTDHTNANSLSNLEVQSRYGFSDQTNAGNGTSHNNSNISSMRTASNTSKYSSQQPEKIIQHPNEETINQQISEDLKDSFSISKAENKEITKRQQQQITTEQKNQCELFNQQVLNSDIGVNQAKQSIKEQNFGIDQIQSRFIKKAEANVLEIDEIQPKQIGEQLQNSDSLFKSIPIDYNRIEDMQFVNFESGLIPLESKQIFSDSVIDQICASPPINDNIMSQTLEVQKTLNVVYQENCSEQIENKQNENILLNNLQQSSIKLNKQLQEKEVKQNQVSQNTLQNQIQLNIPKQSQRLSNHSQKEKQQVIQEDQVKIYLNKKQQNSQINIQIENNTQTVKQTNQLQYNQQPNIQIQQQINKQIQKNQSPQKLNDDLSIKNVGYCPQLAQYQNINNAKQQVNNDDEQNFPQKIKKVQFLVKESEKKQFQQDVNVVEQIQQQTAKQFILSILNKTLNHQTKQTNQFSQLTTDFSEKQNLPSQKITHQNDLHFQQDTDNLSALLQSAKDRFNTLNQQNSGGELINFLKNNDNQIDTSKEETINESKKIMEFTINIFSEKIIGEHKLTSEQQEQQMTKQIFLIPSLNQIFNYSMTINQPIQKQQNLNEATQNQLKQQNGIIKQLEEQHEQQKQQTVTEQQQTQQIQKVQQQNKQLSAKQTQNQIMITKQQDINDDDLLLSHNKSSLKSSNNNQFVEESLECSGKFKTLQQKEHQFSHSNNIQQKQNIRCSKQNQLIYSFKNSKAEFNGNDFICPIEAESNTSYLDDIVKNYQDWKKSRAIKKQLQNKNRKMGLQEINQNIQLL